MPFLPNPAKILRKAKVFLSENKTPTTLKPTGDWIKNFGELAERCGVKKPGKLAWAMSAAERKKLVSHAASHSILDNVGFILCGMYYLMNPREARLAQGIKTVFLTANDGASFLSGSLFQLNLDGQTFKSIDMLARWAGYNDISGLLDVAADNILHGHDGVIRDLLSKLDPTVKAGSGGQSAAPTVIKDLVTALTKSGWKQTDLQAIGLL